MAGPHDVSRRQTSRLKRMSQQCEQDATWVDRSAEPRMPIEDGGGFQGPITQIKLETRLVRTLNPTCCPGAELRLPQINPAQ